ncbi:hypothetical protein FD27_GL001347 [Limosilactobacillus frumenti DSM 13145]|uniref:Small conserved membrane protein n=1 Tax=Limosilactobacillus frumenti DSM 13145 TaxID=1423746 RepID=A0A0R1P8Q4_9LACO|nr:hypothetical protein FD27_GL001347 [Limosilactobacillus frumenti DSM 13145]
MMSKEKVISKDELTGKEKKVSPQVVSKQVEPDKEWVAKRLKQVKISGNIATIACLIMYSSYVEQIIANFSGHPVSPVQPFFAAINATMWVVYGWLKPIKKDWPVIISNFPGIIFGIITAITAFIH